MTHVVVGASTRIGRELTDALAARGDAVVVVSSDRRDLDALVADVGIRRPGSARVVPLAVDVAAGTAWLDELETITRPLGPLRALLFPVGSAVEGDDGSLPPGDVERLVHVNLTSVICAVQRFLPELRETHGTIVGFGSIAASRGRATNVVYAASKRALESFFESVRHRYGARLTVQLYVLGFMDSGARSPSIVPKGDPAALAARVVRDLERDVGVAYYPPWWRYIVLLLRWLPLSVFRRIRA